MQRYIWDLDCAAGAKFEVLIQSSEYSSVLADGF